MASERARIKKDVIESSVETSEPAEYVELLSEAQASQHELVKEQNRSREAMRRMEIEAQAVEVAARSEDKKSEMGTIGRFIGGKENAPVGIALVAVVSGILGAFLCFHYAAYSSAAEM